MDEKNQSLAGGDTTESGVAGSKRSRAKQPRGVFIKEEDVESEGDEARKNVSTLYVARGKPQKNCADNTRLGEQRIV